MAAAIVDCLPGQLDLFATDGETRWSNAPATLAGLAFFFYATTCINATSYVGYSIWHDSAIKFGMQFGTVERPATRSPAKLAFHNLP